MRRPAILGGIAALAVAGTAIAAPGSPVGLLGGDEDPQREFATELARELGGVSSGEVERAMEAVAERHLAERRAEMAAAIAAGLDGVSAERVEAALEAGEQQMRRSFEAGEPPAPGDLAESLAADLGVGEDEVERALEAAREQELDEHRAEAERRLDEAVEQGRISEEQADELRERLEQGPPVPEHGPGGPGLAPGGPPPIGPGGPGGSPPMVPFGDA